MPALLFLVVVVVLLQSLPPPLPRSVCGCPFVNVQLHTSGEPCSVQVRNATTSSTPVVLHRAQSDSNVTLFRLLQKYINLVFSPLFFSFLFVFSE